jgi:hypothetical protein
MKLLVRVNLTIFIFLSNKFTYFKYVTYGEAHGSDGCNMNFSFAAKCIYCSENHTAIFREFRLESHLLIYSKSPQIHVSNNYSSEFLNLISESQIQLLQ